MRFLMYLVMLVVALNLAGCATFTGGSRINQLEQRVQQLENELDSKEQEINNLKFDLTAAPASDDDEIIFDETILSELKAKESKKTYKAPAKPKYIKKTNRNIQRALKSAGYYKGRIDGKIGKYTKRAIRSFQRAKKLRVDGIVGKRTWSALKKYL